MSEKCDILLAENLDDAGLTRLAAVGRLRRAGAADEATLVREIAGAHALLVRSYAQVTERVIHAGRDLRVIGRAGVGLENVDLAAARRHGVAVVYTPAAASDSVAEFTVGLVIALERHLPTGQAMIREGRFLEARKTLLGRELRGLTLGIVGMGRIGRRVARIGHCGLGMAVLYNDLLPVEDLEFPAEAVAKERVWTESDVVSLHVPLTRLTHHLVDAAVLGRFKPSATLINTARGAVLDSLALARALREGRIAGAALDVHEIEPIRPDNPLLSAPKVLLTPHLAARTGTGLANMNGVVDDVVAVLEGREPRYPAGEAE